MHRLPSYIDGRYARVANAPVFDNVNPATGEVISRVEVALEAEVESAIASAQRGFLRWSALSGAERGRVLGKAADILRARNGARPRTRASRSSSGCRS